MLIEDYVVLGEIREANTVSGVISEKKEGEKQEHRSLRKTLLVLIGIVGSIASLISIPLAIYFYTETKQTPLLTYYIHPSRAIVVKAGQASNLTVNYANREIKNDITAVQIAIWNQGRSPIKAGGILRPIVIRTENNIPILEASIRKTSRDLINFKIDSADAEKGIVTLSWNILEQNDGAIIQLIYAGGPHARINLDGVLEGQAQILELQSAFALQSPEEQLRSERRFNMVAGWGLTGLAGVLGIPIFLVFVLSLRDGSFNLRKDWPIIGVPFLFLIPGLYLLTHAQLIGPPFGF